MKLNFVSNGMFKSMKEFEIVKEIGVGSFGKVCIAVHVQTHRFYAVKIVNLSSLASEDQATIFERELKIHSKIDHPHIIKLWDVLEHDNSIYMIMELANNGSLFNYLGDGHKMIESNIFKIFIQTVRAIDFLHRLDIMHRDIKPENILLDSQCNVKICDFGWATTNVSKKRTTFCGTYEYMAPEMAFEKQYNYKIDSWALGVLLYQLSHGNAPFKVEDLSELKEKLKLKSYQIKLTLSPDLRAFIKEILNFNEEKRMTVSQMNENPWVKRMTEESQHNTNKLKKHVISQVSEKPPQEIMFKKNNHKKYCSNLQTEVRKIKEPIYFERKRKSGDLEYTLGSLKGTPKIKYNLKTCTQSQYERYENTVNSKALYDLMKSQQEKNQKEKKKASLLSNNKDLTNLKFFSQLNFKPKNKKVSQKLRQFANNYKGAAQKKRNRHQTMKENNFAER